MEVDNIILIEDELAHVELIKRAFAKRGREESLVIFDRLKPAIDYIDNHPVDMVICDYKLPDGSGLELLEFCQSNPEFPVIMLTSHGDENVAVDSIKLGALDYIVKLPETFESLPVIVDHAAREWESLQANKRANKIFEDVAKGIIKQQGESLFDAMVRSLALSLDADIVLVAEFESQARQNSRTIAAWKDGHAATDVEYELVKSPCAVQGDTDGVVASE